MKGYRKFYIHPSAAQIAAEQKRQKEEQRKLQEILEAIRQNQSGSDAQPTAQAEEPKDGAQ